MPKEMPAVRILPMSDKIEGFRGRTIEEVQERYFRGLLPKRGGRWRYRAAGLNADAGTIVLFQFRARVIASAIFLRDEKFQRPNQGRGGILYFEPESFRTFEPIDAETMRKAWPAFRAFGHVKQFLNPGRYAAFKRRLKPIAPATR
jgi:hypothetical protein